MKKLLYIILTLSVMPIYAQTFYKSSNQQMIEDAIKNGFFICKHSFQVCDKKTGELYGLNNKNEFGTEYSIGIKLPNSILLIDNAVRPWEYNSKYAKYKKDYAPVSYRIMCSEMKEKIKYDSLECKLDSQETLVDSLMYRFTSKSFSGKGFVLDNTIGEKQGWIVWITAGKQNDFEKNLDVNYIIYQKGIQIDKQLPIIDIAPIESEQGILGGIYVTPMYDGLGVIKFHLCGIIARQQNKWKIFCPFIGMGDSEKSNIEEQHDCVPFKLTPVEDKKSKSKKKKNKK